MGIGLDDKRIIKKYKHLIDLTLEEELNYYSGNPISCPFPREIELPRITPIFPPYESDSKRFSRVIK